MPEPASRGAGRPRPRGLNATCRRRPPRRRPGTAPAPGECMVEADETDVTSATADILGLPDDQVRPASRLLEDLGLDGCDTAELVSELGRVLHREVPERLCRPDALLRSLETVADVERLVLHARREGECDDGGAEPDPAGPWRPARRTAEPPPHLRRRS